LPAPRAVTHPRPTRRASLLLALRFPSLPLSFVVLSLPSLQRRTQPSWPPLRSGHAEGLHAASRRRRIQPCQIAVDPVLPAREPGVCVISSSATGVRSLVCPRDCGLRFPGERLAGSRARLLLSRRRLLQITTLCRRLETPRRGGEARRPPLPILEQLRLESLFPLSLSSSSSLLLPPTSALSCTSAIIM